jgi:class 3 adenylate cyclase/tetratricopeptide (TPR) repeat protein
LAFSGVSMRCSNCGSENPTGSRFCNQCGVPFGKTCPKCAVENAGAARFCSQCGAALESIPERHAESQPHERGLGGERRHLTVLFCDLVGSTEIAARLDPEEWREVVASYHRATAAAITRFGGYVAQYLGDGVMAYFGWPEAHDNNAERAAHAGLAIIEAIWKLNECSTGPKLSARVGIDSGSVVVGAGVGRGADIFGDTPNIAARVQATALPNTVLISADTCRLLSGLFVVEDRGMQMLKGIERPIQLYRVIQRSVVRGRLEAVAASRGLTPFVGREDELRLLLNRWERTLEGEGQAVMIIGEAGIGKSRLVQHFRQQITGTPHAWAEAAASPLFQNTPFYPVAELLRQFLATPIDEPSDDQLARLEPALELVGMKPAAAIPLIAPLLNLPVPHKYPALLLLPEQQRRRLLATLIEWVRGVASLQPLVIVVEDLHWADPSTLELLELLLEQGAPTRLLLLHTGRPEFRAPWLMRTHHSQITLNRLSSANVREMVALVATRNSLASESVEAVVERTGGVPLFIEELTHAVLESGSARIRDREIPATLHDSLMVRLDRLGPAKEVIQIGAVIGTDFSYRLLHAVHPIPDEDLQGAILSATNAELVYVRGIPPDATYQFKHALIRDAAYEALLRSRRKELHSRIAEILVEQFPERVTSAPELLAHHYTEAGLFEQAIPSWQRAGQRAMERSAKAEAASHLTKALANAEAVSHLTKALEVLKTLPESRSRAQQELALQVTLGVPIMLTKGYGAPEVERAYSRARELYQQVGESPQFFPMLFGLWAFHRVKAEYSTARELGEQLVSLAETAQDPALLVEAHAAHGDTLSFSGELVLAREHLEQAITLYDSRRDRSHAFIYGQDPGVHSLSYATLTLWLLGYPDQARKRSLEALALAQELSHAFSLAFALIHVVHTHRFTREVEATQQQAKELHVLSSEQRFPLPLAFATAHQGWALAEQGLEKEGIIQIRQAIDIWNATGATLFFKPFLFAMLAEAQAKAQLPEEGLSMLAEALAIVNKTGERFWEAELYRLKGELTLQSQVRGSQSKVQDEAEECFRRAIDIARRQSAKSLELRAVMSLARLQWHYGKKVEAGQMLADTYGWFTEGFNTADLKEAKALLDELSR